MDILSASGWAARGWAKQGKRERVCVAACMRQCLVWCESVNHVLCWQCKVQNSPVCNKTELRVQNRHSSAFQGFCFTRGLDECVPAHTLAQTSPSSLPNTAKVITHAADHYCPADSCLLNRQWKGVLAEASKPRTKLLWGRSTFSGTETSGQRKKDVNDCSFAVFVGVQTNSWLMHRS